MSSSTGKPRDPTENAMLSDNMADFMTAGVVIVVDAEEAESLGAFEETALSEEDAWESNFDGEPEDGE
jgi:hypothetical protein